MKAYPLTGVGFICGRQTSRTLAWLAAKLLASLLDFKNLSQTCTLARQGNEKKGWFLVVIDTVGAVATSFFFFWFGVSAELSYRGARGWVTW